MNPANSPESDDEMKEEYDIREGVRGKYLESYRAGTNVVLLDPDVAAVFRDADAVNRTLRMLIEVARRQVETGSHDRRV